MKATLRFQQPLPSVFLLRRVQSCHYSRYLQFSGDVRRRKRNRFTQANPPSSISALRTNHTAQFKNVPCPDFCQGHPHFPPATSHQNHSDLFGLGFLYTVSPSESSMFIIQSRCLSGARLCFPQAAWIAQAFHLSALNCVNCHRVMLCRLTCQEASSRSLTVDLHLGPRFSSELCCHNIIISNSDVAERMKLCDAAILIPAESDRHSARRPSIILQMTLLGKFWSFLVAHGVLACSVSSLPSV